MNKPTVLTAAQLEAAGACRDQINLFREKFGESVVVTVDRAVQVAHKFNFVWATCLLDASARAEYKRVAAQARAAGYIATCERSS